MEWSEGTCRTGSRMSSLPVADDWQHRSPRRMAGRNATGPPVARLAAPGLASARRVPWLGAGRSRSELKNALLCQKRVGEGSNLGRRRWIGGRGVRGIEWAGGEERRVDSSRDQSRRASRGKVHRNRVSKKEERSYTHLVYDTLGPRPTVRSRRGDCSVFVARGIGAGNSSLECHLLGVVMCGGTCT